MKSSHFLLLVLLVFAAAPALAEECRENGQCDRSQFCSKEIGKCKAPGTCETRPQACTQQYDPVCGCDGRTYGNACTAASNGVSIASEGECPPNCESNADCAEGEFCKFPGMACKGKGRCETRPDLCIQIFDPVCGCDGMTYSNGCFAFMAGTNVARMGECKDKM